MKSTLLALATTCALFAQTSLATIAIGNTGGKTIAWISGQDPCAGWANIADVGQNPCGDRFTLSNGYTYYLGYCGGSDFAVINNDGSYNHACTAVSWSKTCVYPNTYIFTITQGYSC